MSQILSNCAHLFMVSMNEPLTVKEEFLELIPMKDTTTACDIFCSLVITLHKRGVDWSRAVSSAVDGAPSMVR